MANGRNTGSKGDEGRDAGGFVALPWTVLDCVAYTRLSLAARSLLMEFARQFVKDNNGRLLASGAYLRTRGWKSADVITRAKRELLAAGFIFETVRGHRPNKASWYAVTWRRLDRLKGYDEGATELFKRGAYAAGVSLQPQCTREELYEKWRKPAEKNADLTPSGGVAGALTEPSGGVEGLAVAPSGGVVDPISVPPPTPSHGDHLEMPSIATLAAATTAHEPAPDLAKSIDGVLGGDLTRAASSVAEAPSIDIVRVRDRDQDPDRYYNGEHFPAPPAPPRRQRQAADAWVKTALAATRNTLT